MFVMRGSWPVVSGNYLDQSGVWGEAVQGAVSLVYRLQARVVASNRPGDDSIRLFPCRQRYCITPLCPLDPWWFIVPLFNTSITLLSTSRPCYQTHMHFNALKSFIYFTVRAWGRLFLEFYDFSKIFMYNWL